jgi:regulator of sigma E protease
MSILIFILVLSILILVHEFGHFIVARILGVRVERFALGFGPKLLAIKGKETEYSVCLFPLGGFVKLAGDNPEDFKGKPDEYLSRTPGERAGIIFAGPLLNYVLGFLCFFFVFLMGYPNLTSKVGGLIDGYPAKDAGIRVSDKVTVIDSKPVNTWEELQLNVHNKTSPIEITVLRDNKELHFKMIPRQEKVKNIFGQQETVSLVGIKPLESEIVFIKHNFAQSFTSAFKKIIEITAITFKALFRMVTGAMSMKDSVTGPLGIFYITKKAALMGFIFLVHVMAVLSTSLGIFNLLPLPLLDGGCLALLGVEKLKGKPLSKKVDDFITRLGFSLIIFLALFVFYNDLVKFGVVDKVISFFNK